MNHHTEVRAGHTDIGPHALQKWSVVHQFRNFDLSTIMAFVEIESVVNQLLEKNTIAADQDEAISKAVVAGNALSSAKGYLPIFETKDGVVTLTEDIQETLKTFFDSEDWIQQSRKARPRLISNKSA